MTEPVTTLRVKNNEYLPVVYNGTFGEQHFCIETVPMSVKTNAHKFYARLFLLTSVLCVVMFHQISLSNRYLYTSSCS